MLIKEECQLKSFKSADKTHRVSVLINATSSGSSDVWGQPAAMKCRPKHATLWKRSWCKTGHTGWIELAVMRVQHGNSREISLQPHLNCRLLKSSVVGIQIRISLDYCLYLAWCSFMFNYSYRAFCCPKKNWFNWHLPAFAAWKKSKYIWPTDGCRAPVLQRQKTTWELKVVNKK